MKNKDLKKKYSKPQVQRVRLSPSEEVLAAGCKTSTTPSSYIAPDTCNPLGSCLDYGS